jgi:hypothetical protein
VGPPHHVHKVHRVGASVGDQQQWVRGAIAAGGREREPTSTATKLELHGGRGPVTPKGAHKGQPTAITTTTCPNRAATTTGTKRQIPHREGILVLIRCHQQAQGGAHRQAEPPSALRSEGRQGHQVLQRKTWTDGTCLRRGKERGRGTVPGVAEPHGES